MPPDMRFRVGQHAFAVREVDQWEYEVYCGGGQPVAIVYARPENAAEGCREAAAALVERGLV